MATVPERIGIGEGGPGVAQLEDILNDIADDLSALRASIVGITAKLDADATVTDTDYAATLDPAARTHIGSHE